MEAWKLTNVFNSLLHLISVLECGSMQLVCFFLMLFSFFFLRPYTEGFSLFDGAKQMVLVVKALGKNCLILMLNLILIEMIPTMIVVR